MTLARSPTAATAESPGSLTRLRLSVVLVNYCQWGNTLRLVRQLHRSRCLRRAEAEIVVIDNHSPTHPGTVTLRRRRHVSLRRWGRNRGFARAANEGVRLSRGDWILFLNPDTSVADGFLDQVVAHLETLPELETEKIGIIGLGLRDPDGRVQPSTGPFPRLSTTLLRLLLPRRHRKYGNSSAWVTGCGMLARRDCLQQLQGFDPDFFLYYEDVDLCRRATAAGWTVRHEPTPTLIHHRPLHGRPVPPHIRLFTRHALLTYASRYWPRWQTTLLTRLIGLEAWARRCVALWRGERRAAWVFRELGRLTDEVASGTVDPRRVRRVARHLEVRRAALSVDRHSHTQSSRPAPPLPCDGDAVRAAADPDPGG